MAFVRAAFLAASGCVSARLLKISLLTMFTVASSVCWAGPGGDGHTHGDEIAPSTAAASPRVSMTGEIYDVVGILRNGRVVFYVDRLTDNTPVTDAKLEVALGSAKIALNAPEADGTYVMDAGGLARGGSHELIVSIQGAEGDDLVAGTMEPIAQAHARSGHPHLSDRLRAMISGPLIFASGLLLGVILGALLWRRRAAVAAMVLLASVAALMPSAFGGPGGDGHTHGDEQTAPVATNAPHRLPDGSVFLPKPTQRLLEVRTLKVEESEVRKTVSLPGRVIASPRQSGVVQSINGGRIAPIDGKLPGLGQKVSKGQLLAQVEPPVNAADETTIADKAGEISQQITLAEIRLLRLTPLAASNAVPKTQVTDLEAELASLKKRHANIRAQRRQPEELLAPVDGEIAAVRVIAGQVVAPQDQIFHIIDPRAMWVEAFVFGELEPSSITSAVAVGHNKKSLPLRFEGLGRVLQLHTVQLQFSIENPPSNLMVGEPVTVLAQTNEQFKGTVLPRTAVIRAANGQMIVWHHSASERFIPVPVRIEPLDGERIAVLGGLELGQRVVVRAAELINQVR